MCTPLRRLLCIITRVNEEDFLQQFSCSIWLMSLFEGDREYLEKLSEAATRHATNKNIKLACPRPKLKFYKVDWQWFKVNKDDLCKRFVDEVNKGRAEGKK